MEKAVQKTKVKAMEAYAVLETGGKQVLVKAGDTIEIEKLSTEPGQEVVLDTVCAVSDGTTLKVGAPYVEGAKVTLAINGRAIAARSATASSSRSRRSRPSHKKKER